MKKMVGYVIAITGLVVLALGLGMFKFDIGFLEGVKEMYILIGAGVLIAVGIGLSLMDKSGGGRKKKGGKEIPIYQGKDVVGYRVH